MKDKCEKEVRGMKKTSGKRKTLYYYIYIIREKPATPMLGCLKNS